MNAFLGIFYEFSVERLFPIKTVDFSHFLIVCARGWCCRCAAKWPKDTYVVPGFAGHRSAIVMLDVP